jgi:hypothetical protein
MLVMNAPIEIDTVGFFFPIAIPVIIGGRSTGRIAMYVGSVMVYHYLWNQLPPPPPCLISRRESLHTVITTNLH